MKERPILFSGPMVRAILEGRKTQTRRVISPQNCHFGSAPKLFWEHCDFDRAWVDGKGPDSHLQYLHVPCHVDFDEGSCKSCDVCREWGWDTTSHRLWPIWWPFESYYGEEAGRPAHRLWVREVFQPLFANGVKYEDTDWQTGKGYAPRYVATDGRTEWMDLDDDKITDRCKSSIHMPRWASRITLEITDVRVQRLQEISAVDALAEGVAGTEFWTPKELESRPFEEKWWDDFEFQNRYPQIVFQRLWDSINAKRGFGWNKNPWVWAITFKRVQP